MLPDPNLANATNHNDEEESLRITYAGAKRRIAALEHQLQTIQGSETKRKS